MKPRILPFSGLMPFDLIPLISQSLSLSSTSCGLPFCQSFMAFTGATFPRCALEIRFYPNRLQHDFQVLTCELQSWFFMAGGPSKRTFHCVSATENKRTKSLKSLIRRNSHRPRVSGFVWWNSKQLSNPWQTPTGTRWYNIYDHVDSVFIIILIELDFQVVVFLRKRMWFCTLFYILYSLVHVHCPLPPLCRPTSSIFVSVSTVPLLRLTGSITGADQIILFTRFVYRVVLSLPDMM